MNEQATLEEIIGWLRGLDKERVLGATPERGYCENCVMGAYVNREGGNLLTVAAVKIYPLDGDEAVRALGPDERFLRDTFDRVLHDRGTDRITAGDFLDELAEVAFLTDNERLRGALA